MDFIQKCFDDEIKIKLQKFNNPTDLSHIQSWTKSERNDQALEANPGLQAGILSTICVSQ